MGYGENAVLLYPIWLSRLKYSDNIYTTSDEAEQTANDWYC